MPKVFGTVKYWIKLQSMLLGFIYLNKFIQFS